MATSIASFFLDKSTVKAERYHQFRYRKGEPTKKKPKLKHQAAVHVWTELQSCTGPQISVFLKVLVTCAKTSTAIPFANVAKRNVDELRL